jgi:hypothetical protein
MLHDLVVQVFGDVFFASAGFDLSSDSQEPGAHLFGIAEHEKESTSPSPGIGSMKPQAGKQGPMGINYCGAVFFRNLKHVTLTRNRIAGKSH